MMVTIVLVKHISDFQEKCRKQGYIINKTSLVIYAVTRQLSKKESSDLIITDGYITSNDPYDNS